VNAERLYGFEEMGEKRGREKSIGILLKYSHQVLKGGAIF